MFNCLYNSIQRLAGQLKCFLRHAHDVIRRSCELLWASALYTRICAPFIRFSALAVSITIKSIKSERFQWKEIASSQWESEKRALSPLEILLSTYTFPRITRHQPWWKKWVLGTTYIRSEIHPTSMTFDIESRKHIRLPVVAVTS